MNMFNLIFHEQSIENLKLMLGKLIAINVQIRNNRQFCHGFIMTEVGGECKWRGFKFFFDKQIEIAYNLI